MGQFDSDGIMMETEDDVEIFYDPIHTEQQHHVGGLTARPLMQKVMEDGHIIGPLPSATESARYCITTIFCFIGECKRFENPQRYKVGLSPSLMRLRTFLFEQMQKGSLAKK